MHPKTAKARAQQPSTWWSRSARSLWTKKQSRSAEQPELCNLYAEPVRGIPEDPAVYAEPGDACEAIYDVLDELAVYDDVTDSMPPLSIIDCYSTCYSTSIYEIAPGDAFPEPTYDTICSIGATE